MASWHLGKVAGGMEFFRFLARVAAVGKEAKQSETGPSVCEGAGGAAELDKASLLTAEERCVWDGFQAVAGLAAGNATSAKGSRKRSRDPSDNPEGEM